MGQSTCTVGDCLGKHVARGYCSKHYQSARARRDFEPTGHRQLQCPICRRIFFAGHPTRRYCSPQCNSVAQNRKRGNLPAGVKRCRTCTRTLRIAAFDLHTTSCRQCLSLRVEGRKRCKRCGEVKPRSEFYARRSKDGHEPQCKPCTRDRCKELNSTPEGQLRIRNQHLEYRYGISLVQYHQLLAQQYGACAVCLGPSNGAGKFHVDHDHSCCPGDRTCGNCIRGLLCSNCNFAVGAMRDSPEAARRLVAYLEQHRPRSPMTPLFPLALITRQQVSPVETAVTHS